MIAFDTLLLGLVIGTVPVRLTVGPQFASAELLLDGATVATITAPPWAARCDLGPEPHPHELVAIARDRDGAELGRTHQWVNVPRAEAEAGLALERNQRGVPVAGVLTWENLVHREPKRVKFTLDGRRLATRDNRRAVLPPFDMARIHLLSAELVFAAGVTARADLAFGGDLGEQARADLTAVPVVLEPDHELPGLDAMRDWFAVDGREIRVVAVETTPARVVLVLDRATRSLWHGWKEMHRKTIGPGELEPAEPDADELYIQAAAPAAIDGTDGGDRSRQLFPLAGPFDLWSPHLYVRVASLQFPTVQTGDQTFSEAVAAAGLRAAARNRRRAVVLGLAGGTSRARFDGQAARTFLSDLRVPLRCWLLSSKEGRGVATPWGEAEPTGSDEAMTAALTRLRGDLDRQRIVWLAGAHLPQRIQLTPKAVGVYLAQ